MTPSAHFWTILPVVLERLKPLEVPDAEPWEHVIDDPDVGPVRLSGELRRGEDRRELLILLHGLGGCSRSRYCSNVVVKARQQGLSTLQLNLRGCDRRGEDLYHAALTSDLSEVLAEPTVAAFERVYLLGFSLGGHLALRYATEVEDPRLRAVTAVCSPLDLSRAVDAFDRPPRWLYRRYILQGLRDIYASIEARRQMPATSSQLRGTTKLRDFDRQVVVPRFGFASVEDYYRRASVAPHLDRLRVPSLLVAARHDPIVTHEAIACALDRPLDNLEVRWTASGGHVSFPPALDLGYGPEPGLEAQVLHWLRRSS